MTLHRIHLVSACLMVATASAALAQGRASTSAAAPDPRLEKLKAEALTKVESRAKLIQEMVDMLFSFGELGFQEFETSKYLTGILEQNGFKVERGVAGIPTSWVAAARKIGRPRKSPGRAQIRTWWRWASVLFCFSKTRVGRCPSRVSSETGAGL